MSEKRSRMNVSQSAVEGCRDAMGARGSRQERRGFRVANAEAANRGLNGREFGLFSEPVRDGARLLGSRRFVLLDRDGTIIVEKNYLSDPAEVELLPGAVEGLALLQKAGFGLAVVTNQSGIGRGYYSVHDMDAVNARMSELLAGAGVVLNGVYFCPHAPGEKCDCRKPRPGMALRAAGELGFVPSRAVVIGDKDADLGLARAIGALGVLVRTGYGTAQESMLSSPPDIIADNLLDAAERILEKLEMN